MNRQDGWHYKGTDAYVYLDKAMRLLQDERVSNAIAESKRTREISRLLDTIEELHQQRAELQATADRFAEIMADKDRQLIAVARQRGEMLNALIAARNLVIDKFSCKSDVIKLLQDAIDKQSGQQT